MFLYFVEGHESISLEQARSLGLGHAFDETPKCRAVRGGPDGKNGCIAAADQRLKTAEGKPLSVRYAPDEQAWSGETPISGVRVGYYHGHPPTPDSLARAEQLPGYVVPTCDGQEWRFPSVRQVDEEGQPQCLLPSTYRQLPSRKLVPDKPLERCRWLWDATEEAWQALVADADLPEEHFVELAGKLLSANYYATDVELATLGAFGQTFWGEVNNIVSLCVGAESFFRWKEAQETPGKSLSAETGSSASDSSAA
ncbi:MAG: hypothetical protein AAGJ46_14445 [Planctomycetota bacterium]